VPDYNQRLMGTSFLAQNANKKSVTLNMKSAKALDDGRLQQWVGK